MKIITLIFAAPGRGPALAAAASKLAEAVAASEGVRRCAVNVRRSDGEIPTTPSVDAVAVGERPFDLMAETWLEDGAQGAAGARRIEDALRRAGGGDLAEARSCSVFEREMMNRLPANREGAFAHTNLLAFMHLRPELSLQQVKDCWLDHGRYWLSLDPPVETYIQNVVLERFSDGGPNFGGVAVFAIADYQRFYEHNEREDPEHLRISAEDFGRWATGCDNVLADEHVKLGRTLVR